MTAHSLPVPLVSKLPASAQGARPRNDLSLRITGALACIAALELALTVLAASQLQGAAAVAAMVLGALALLLLLATGVWLLRRVVHPLGPVTRALGRMGTGDLTNALDGTRGGELRPLVQALQQMREHLLGVVSQVRTGTTNMALVAAVMNRDNEALSRRTATQADSLQETAASLEQLATAVRQNAGTAQQAHGLARAASDRAQHGGAVMREVVETMQSIRASSGSIRDIVGVIDAIAFQTNILALNAAVEAARAGEQGRGFAVVAGEVRILAQRCGKAAREIRALVAGSVGTVDQGVARVDEASRSMAEIVGAVRQVAELIGRINAASQEQSSGIDTITLAMSRIDGTTQENVAFVRGASRTAAALHERAVSLQDAVAGFSLGEAEHGEAADAIRLVQRGCEFLRARGRQALLDDVNRLDRGELTDRDLYLMVLDLADGVFVAHGSNPGRLATGPEVRDIDGKPFAREWVRVARERGEGWVDYKWVHPVTQQVFTKSGYVRREGGLALVCAVTRG